MKKIFSLLLVLGVAIMLPMSAKALALDTTNACEKSCPTEGGKCEQVCTIKVKDNESANLTELKINVNTSAGVTIKSVTAANGWTLLSGSTASPVQLMATSAVTDKNFTAATVVFEIENAQTDCTVSLGLNDVTYEITTETTTQVKTGVSIPLAIIAGGAGIALVIYAVTKKSKKLYKI